VFPRNRRRPADEASLMSYTPFSNSSPVSLAKVALAFGAVSLTACASLEAVTAGHVGCPPDEITVSGESETWGASSWTAECHGKLYYCSAAGGGRGAPDVACREATETAASDVHAMESGGCKADTECKGTRVCRSHACTDP
jgi:hypothetical protein